MNPPALYDVLNLTCTAVLLAESGDTAQAATLLMEASLAALDAFPDGTPESAALWIILAAAGRVPAEVAP